MLLPWMVVVIAFFVSFALSSFLFSKLIVFDIFRVKNFSAAASTVLGSIVSAIIFMVFYWTENDFVKDISVWTFLAPLIGLTLIFVACLIDRLYVIDVAVWIASVIGVFGGDLFIEFIPEGSVVVNKICSVIAWSVFSVAIRCIAMLYPVLQIQGITIGCGLVALYVFGSAPFMLGLIGATFLAAMMVAYLNYYNQTLGVTVSPIIGYIIGWFGLIMYNEMLMPCFLVLVMFCLIEVFICLIKKLTFMKKYQNFLYNSVLIQVYKSGFPADAIIKSLWFLSGIVLMFCIFQANGVNSYSIPVFIAVVILWHFYRLLNWKNEEKSWKDINKEVVEDTKEAIAKIVKSSSKVKKETVKNKKVKTTPSKKTKTTAKKTKSSKTEKRSK